ncbi:hypothetical protein GW17_00056577 [Ensete ventricosum]|nr:hypothetical protein GW17_00056577 [Ensete ventricosum]
MHCVYRHGTDTVLVPIKCWNAGTDRCYLGRSLCFHITLRLRHLIYFKPRTIVSVIWSDWYISVNTNLSCLSTPVHTGVSKRKKKEKWKGRWKKSRKKEEQEIMEEEKKQKEEEEEEEEEEKKCT